MRSSPPAPLRRRSNFNISLTTWCDHTCVWHSLTSASKFLSKLAFAIWSFLELTWLSHLHSLHASISVTVFQLFQCQINESEIISNPIIRSRTEIKINFYLFLTDHERRIFVVIHGRLSTKDCSQSPRRPIWRFCRLRIFFYVHGFN